MKLMCSGVTSCAATTRSPSVSRSSSSTTMTNLPASKSAIASGTVARLICFSGMLPAEVSGHVPGHEIGLEIDDRTSLVAVCDRHFDGVRDQRDSERARGVVHLSHREAHAIHGDGPLDRDEP